MNRKKLGLAAILLIVACVAALVWAFLSGSAGLSLGDIWTAMSGKFFGGERNASVEAILFQVRLPRALTAMLVGGALGVSGACMQGVFMNPMADPHIMGVSSGAALGATIGIILGWSKMALGLSLNIILAFAGGIGSVLLVYTIARANRRMGTVGLLLTGVAVSSFLTAMISVLMVLNRDKLDQIVMWTMGSLSSAGWPKLAVAAPVILISTLSCMLFSRELNICMLGEAQARHLGVRVERMRMWVITLSTLATAAAVSISGIIGFVGLMAPHALRLILGPDHRALLPFSLLGGALFLLCVDTLARTIAAPMELPVGVLTALLGGPCFLALLRRAR